MIISQSEHSDWSQNPAYSTPSRPHIKRLESAILSQRRRKTSQLAKLPLPIAVLVIGIYFIATFVFPAEEEYVPAEGTALEQLETLEIKGRAPKTGYSRDEFGNGWLDPDGNGCDARNDVLTRDLESVVHADDSCKVLTAVLQDPFTGQTIDFIRGAQTSTDVQIDHVVALSDAWQKGAQQLSAAERERFANDPVNLLAVDGPANGQKSDADAATWLPPNKDFRCEFVAIQTAVKAKYDLWVTEPEHDAIADVLSECPDEPAYTTDDELALLRQ